MRVGDLFAGIGGAPVKGRADRIRALGNAWCPAQGALALRALLGERGQLCIL